MKPSYRARRFRLYLPGVGMPRQGYSEDQIKEFLSFYRFGVDLGEAAGGLALLLGTDILHVETYLDFHEATLETKRTLRRGRRTRHAKKMRLARVRS